ncbi:Hypothetical protein, predicted transmembrane protein [Metamycoplasma auris 15026]|uniref:Transmembrane protein n=1 Tax=Metamycoplasma auris 15026 TaxID=1188233 RepID=N9VC95_9BACT|nr:hypothetical protein [Metamycoplasma auris]ENY69303.1 Hypothetical protein, predicted transmembrane protein [Metamycoplasma auris 15026]
MGNKKHTGHYIAYVVLFSLTMIWIFATLATLGFLVNASQKAPEAAKTTSLVSATAIAFWAVLALLGVSMFIVQIIATIKAFMHGSVWGGILYLIGFVLPPFALIASVVAAAHTSKM